MNRKNKRKKGASLVEAALVLPYLLLAAGAFLSFGLEQYLSVKEQAEEHRVQMTEEPWRGAARALTADILLEEGKKVLPQ